MFQAKITLSTRPPGTQNAADGVYIANDFFFKTHSNHYTMKVSQSWAFVLLGATALLFASCAKEGPQGPAGPAGPAGAAGPAGPAGEGASFAIYETSVAPGDWQAAYVEFAAPNITEAVFNEGVVLVYVQDEYGYWNQMPSAWTPITGWAYFWTADTGGIVGLDHDPATTVDLTYPVRVVTMGQRDYEVLTDDILADCDKLIEVLRK